MKNLSAVLFFYLLLTSCFSQWPPSFNYGNQSFAYEELITAYQELAETYDEAQLLTIGKTDIGKPLHAFIIDKEQAFSPQELSKRTKPVLFINNGIHPGEPCGIDASFMLAEQMLQGYIPIPNIQLIFIPVFNVGGMLNRTCCSRANQNGPALYGFRGNAKNLDLNRDFMKLDAENTAWLVNFIDDRDPDVFIDTHTSNGADYQYTMTLIQSQPDKMAPNLAQLQDQELVPFLYEYMEQRNFPLIPYVYTIGKTPETGIKDYLDSPRYSTGYTSFRNTLSFVSETHMWKPFEERVKSTYLLLFGLANWMEINSSRLIESRKKANEWSRKLEEVAVNWELDTTQVDSIGFLGYESTYITSSISGLDRLYYDREKPFMQNIPYYHHYKANEKVPVPEYYLIPQAWNKIVQKLITLGVEVRQLKNDKSLMVNQHYIKNFNTSKSPYEGHYIHYQTQTASKEGVIQFYAGDFVIKTNQPLNQLIVNALHPKGIDSYFSWGFFDASLQQKEWFSDYVFEEKAKELLVNNPSLAIKLRKELDANPELKNKHWEQLAFIYKNSPYYEPSAFRYPVYEFNYNLGPILSKPIRK